MLTTRQITKLAKPATDKQIAKDALIRTTEGFWTSGVVALCEDVPNGIAEGSVKCDSAIFDRFQRLDQEATISVFPVEIRGFVDSIGGTGHLSKGVSLAAQVLLSDGEHKVWLNAYYLGAMIRRGATDFALSPTLGHVACRNGRTIGLIAGMSECAADWRLSNWELPTKGNHESRNA